MFLFNKNQRQVHTITTGAKEAKYNGGVSIQWKIFWISSKSLTFQDFFHSFSNSQLFDTSVLNIMPVHIWDKKCNYSFLISRKSTEVKYLRGKYFFRFLIHWKEPLRLTYSFHLNSTKYNNFFYPVLIHYSSLQIFSYLERTVTYLYF